jgi:hypothetical protein
VSSHRGRVPAFASLALDADAVCHRENHDLSRTRIIDFVGQGVLLNLLEGQMTMLSSRALPDPTSLHRPHITTRYLSGHANDIARSPSALHLFYDEPSPTAAKTTVGFMRLPSLWGTTCDALASLRPPSQSTEASPVRRAVINIGFHPEDTLLGDAVYCIPPLQVEELVWVFHLARRPALQRHKDIDAYDEDLCRYGSKEMVTEVIRAVGASLHFGTAVTVVGLEALTDLWDHWGDDSPEYRHMLKYKEDRREENPVGTFLSWGHRAEAWDLGQGKKYAVPTPNSRGTVRLKIRLPEPKVTVKLKFKTLAEFREELGLERAGIETCESGWME